MLTKLIIIIAQIPVQDLQGCDFSGTEFLIRAMVENQASNVLFYVGTNDARNIHDMLTRAWFRRERVSIYGWDIFPESIEKAYDKLKTHVSVELFHSAVSETDGMQVNVQSLGTAGTQLASWQL